MVDILFVLIKVETNIWVKVKRNVPKITGLMALINLRNSFTSKIWIRLPYVSTILRTLTILCFVYVVTILKVLRLSEITLLLLVVLKSWSTTKIQWFKWLVLNSIKCRVLNTVKLYSLILLCASSQKRRLWWE